MWVRGLKRADARNAPSTLQVAPYVGAWIETSFHASYLHDSHVAPYVGAWIETLVY